MLMIWHMEHRHTGETCFSGNEAPDYDSIEKTFGHCKTLGEMEITPVRKW